MVDLPYEDLLGKPFAYHGRGPDVYDCYGLAREVLRRGGIHVPDYASAEEYAAIDRVFAAAARQWRRVFPDEGGCIALPCLVAFQLRPPWVSHVGAMLDRDRFIHIMERSSVTVERLSAPEWIRRFAGWYRWEARP